jgi:aspartyl-tRNA(Asn)/glutamyl-tRNA(Gln) amidotransferase subunit B
MNSFRFLERGVRAELDRQQALIEAGEEVVQETLHFDPASGTLTPLRSKEEAHDYRYFPEPDLVPLDVSAEMIAAGREQLPELPAARAERFERDLGLDAARAHELAFRRELGDYFERALAVGDRDGASAVAIANWIPQLVERIGSDADPADSKVAPGALATLATMVAAKQVSRDAAREVLTTLVESGGDPREIVAREGLGAISDGDAGQLRAIVDSAIASDPNAAAKVRDGNMKAIGPLVGYVMRETKGRADGGEVTRLIRERLAAGS